MKTHGILHCDLAKAIAALGHKDMLAIVDRGFPFPRHEQTACIDLAVGRNVPRVADVLSTVLEELEIESAILAKETELESPEAFAVFQRLLASVSNKGRPVAQEAIPHAELRDLVLNGALEGKEMKAMVRTGEFTPFANIILVSGVVF